MSAASSSAGALPLTPVLDKGSPIPLYHQLRTVLERQIERGDWKQGDRLPPEDELAVRYEVSKITVREALKLLSAAGLVRREQGRGTFVNAPLLTQGPRQLTCFTGEMRQSGLRASSRVLEAEVIFCGADLARTLEIPAGDAVFRLKRVRYANDEAMGIQTARLPLSLVPGIVDEDFSNSSLYGTLERRYGLKPTQARETHFAVALEVDDARQLGLEAGAPALAAERVARLADGRPLEYVVSVMRGDRYKIVLNLGDL
jgi:GntR family transcriptional regulator